MIIQQTFACIGSAVVILSVSGGSSAEVNCGTGQPMYHRHESDCSKFYQCSNGEPYLHSCPAGLKFNKDIDVCDWPANVVCEAVSWTILPYLNIEFIFIFIYLQPSELHPELRD